MLIATSTDFGRHNRGCNKKQYCCKGRQKVSKFGDGYIEFLSKCKTERECVNFIVKELEKDGFKDIDKVNDVKSGDRVYYNKMGKALVAFKIGDDDIEKGMNILGAHIDSPRLDAKTNPIYEKDGLVYLNTHYYGGIKKYQWITLPLALHGVVCLKNGKRVDVCVGEDEDDPVFCISDILPHLAYEQMAKKASEFIEAELLDVIIGSTCDKARDDDNKDDDKKDVNKDNILSILKKKYSIEEEDFVSSEIEVVPSGKARYSGFDKSMVLGYGQDDRVCAYSSFKAFMDTKNQSRTLCLLLSDKEEIGSYGATGMDSALFDNAVSEVVYRLKKSSQTDTNIRIRRALSNSYMLSSDVNASYDPLNPNLYDKQNASALSEGLVFNKYTGSRGKSGASDANPEFIALIRDKLDKDGVKYQFAELGKVEAGGGGTIALYAARFGMNVIDAGVSVLSMHAPWELTSVYDIEMAYKGYCSFLGLKQK